jgi:ABC-type tungstate transport system substrate-binding protein
MKEAKMFPLLIGLLLYVLLHSVPFLGWVIGVVFTALGIGSTVVAYIDYRRRAPMEPAQA